MVTKLIGEKITQTAIEFLTDRDIHVKRDTVYLPPHRNMTKDEKSAASYLAYEQGYNVVFDTCINCNEAKGEYDKLCHICYDKVNQ